MYDDGRNLDGWIEREGGLLERQQYDGMNEIN